MTDHCLEESRGLSGGTPQGLPACPPRPLNAWSGPGAGSPSII